LTVANRPRRHSSKLKRDDDSKKSHHVFKRRDVVREAEQRE
jgi:hypothetical protein